MQGVDKASSIERSIGKFPPNYTQELSGGGGVSWTAGLITVRNVHINQVYWLIQIRCRTVQLSLSEQIAWETMLGPWHHFRTQVCCLPCAVVRSSLSEFVLTADLLERAEFMQRKLIEMTDAADDAARERELAAEVAAAVRVALLGLPPRPAPLNPAQNTPPPPHTAVAAAAAPASSAYRALDLARPQQSCKRAWQSEKLRLRSKQIRWRNRTWPSRPR